MNQLADSEPPLSGSYAIMPEAKSRQTELQVQRSRPVAARGFDLQFWPIVIALCTLSAFTAGAIVALLDGSARWISLLAIPALLFIALLVLGSVDNRKLKRSLQLGLILSLTIHLLFVIFAGQVHLFDRSPVTEDKPNEKAPAPRVLKISVQSQSRPWEKINNVEISDVPDEVERVIEETPLPEMPQRTRVETERENTNSNLQRRIADASSAPRAGKSLSQLRRSDAVDSPDSSVRAEPSAALDSPSRSAPEMDSRSAAAARSGARPSSSDATRSRLEPQSARGLESIEVQRRSRQQPTAPVASREPAPRAKARTASAMDSPADARAEQVAVASEPSRRPAEPVVRDVGQAAEVARQAAATDPSARKRSDHPSPSQLAENSAALPQRRTENNQASTQLNSQLLNESRRAADTASQPATPRDVETSAVHSKAVARREPAQLSQPRLAIDRSAAGNSGIGRSRNLASDVGSIESPAQTPMQAARRERQTNSELDSQALSAMSAATRPDRSAQRFNVAASTLAASSAPTASLAAKREISDLTQNASAAELDASARESADQVSAEKGIANADIGPPRVVTETRIERVAGGGQPEINLNDADRIAERNPDRSHQQPAINADAAATAAAPLDPPSDRAATETSPITESDVAGRQPQSGENTVADNLESFRNNRAPETSANGKQSDQPSRTSRVDADETGDSAIATAERSSRPARNPASASANSQLDSPQAVASSPIVEPGGSDRRGIDTGAREPAIAAPRNATSGTIIRGEADADTTYATGESPDNQNLRRRAGIDHRLDPDARPEFAETTRSRTGTAGGGPHLAADAAEPVELQRDNQSGSGDTPGIAEFAKSDAVARQPAKQGRQLDLDALPGPAGLAQRPEVQVGIADRRSRSDSPNLLPETESRFTRDDSGSVPQVDSDAVVAKSAFRQRQPANQANAAPSTEEAIERGLEFLARYQLPDGRWSLKQFDAEHPQHDLIYDSDTAATGLAVLAFQGAGYNHREFRYADRLNKAIEWLVQNQLPNGDLFVPGDPRTNQVCHFYSHGIAALALTEAYGMTQDPQLREPAQLAIDFIQQTQNERYGGWRYDLSPRSQLTPTDTSVSGWMVMALQSARLAGLEVDDQTFAGIEKWLGFASETDRPHLYRYEPFAQDTALYSRERNRQASPAMTSVGLLMRLYTGWSRDDQRLRDGAEYLLQNLPTEIDRRKRDTYYWYYATQVLRHVGGETWERWNAELHPLLVRSQLKQGPLAGSWHPYRPVPDIWARNGGGRLYLTTMNLLSLEVDYRLLPLYDDTAK